MEENSKSSNSKILIIALTILLFGLIGYTFYNNNDHKEAIKFLQDEKGIAMSPETIKEVLNATG